MFNSWERSSILLIVFCFSYSTVLQAQDDTADTDLAFAILGERGELVFEFFPENNFVVKEINTFLSVDRRTYRGFEAYAGEAGFRAFLEYDIPFRIIQRGPGKKSLNATKDFPGDWDVYPSHREYVGFMEETAGSYPLICRLDTIGKSVEGRAILVMKITDNPGNREPEPAFVYSSTMHGDEPTGYVTLLHLIDYICKNYKQDSLVTKLVDGMEIWINPLANPDGTYFTGNDSIYRPKRYNFNDIDLNRDFPGILGTNNNTYSDLQPETRAQMEFLKSIYMVSGANFHEGAELVNYPFDTWADLHADDGWYRETSLEYAQEAQQRSGVIKYMESTWFPQGITNGWEWYFTEGSRQDWTNYYNNAREVTIEISQEKHPPASELPYFWYYNYPSLLRYMEQALFGIHGIVRDLDTGGPLEATIFLPGHDKLGSQIFSDSMTGYFARPVEPGTWNLEVSAEGYETLQVNGVSSLSNQAYWLEVKLRSLESGTRHSQEVSGIPFLYGTDLSIPVRIAGMHSILLYDLNGRLVYRYSQNYPSAGRYLYSLEGSKLVSGVYILKLITPEDIRSHKIFKSQ